MNDVFKALADPTRRALLDRLRANNGQSLGQLGEGLGISRQAITKHLILLETADLITSQRAGREKRHFLNPVPLLGEVQPWLDKYRELPLSRLER